VGRSTRLTGVVTVYRVPITPLWPLYRSVVSTRWNEVRRGRHRTCHVKELDAREKVHNGPKKPRKNRRRRPSRGHGGATSEAAASASGDTRNKSTNGTAACPSRLRAGPRNATVPPDPPESGWLLWEGVGNWLWD
jgi:hypothetical protein